MEVLEEEVLLLLRLLLLRLCRLPPHPPGLAGSACAGWESARGLHLQSDVAQFSRLLPRTQFIKEIEILFGQFLRSRSLWRVRAHFCAGAHCTFGRVSSIARRHRERERDRERDIYRERERALLGSIHNGGSRSLRLGEERGKSLLAAPPRRREG